MQWGYAAGLVGLRFRGPGRGDRLCCPGERPAAWPAALIEVADPTGATGTTNAPCAVQAGGRPTRGAPLRLLVSTTGFGTATGLRLSAIAAGGLLVAAATASFRWIRRAGRTPDGSPKI